MYKKFQKVLQNAPEEHTFNTEHGEVKNLRELRSMLFSKGKKFFNQHVNKEKNDFANWVEHVFKDKELSNSLRQTTSFHTTLKVLDIRIKYIMLWLQQNQEKEQLTNHILKNNNFNLSFKPEHHKFETLSNHDTDWVNEFFPEKNLQEPETKELTDYEEQLNSEIAKLKNLQNKDQFETKPGIFQRLFKKK